MKKLLILMLIAFSTANANKLDLTMKCYYIDAPELTHYIQKCENDEVVCYVLEGFWANSMSCEVKK